MFRSLTLFLAGIFVSMLGAACSQGGTAGTWIALDDSPRLGTWLVISDDATFSRNGRDGIVVEDESGSCLSIEGNSACYPFVVDGDNMVVRFLGEDIVYKRIDPDALEVSDPNHELVGQWDVTGANITIDFLPNGQWVQTDSMDNVSRGYWGADGNVYCEVFSPMHDELITQAQVDGEETPPLWKGNCKQIEITGIYAAISIDGDLNYTLRKVAP